MDEDDYLTVAQSSTKRPIKSINARDLYTSHPENAENAGNARDAGNAGNATTH